MSVSEFSTRFRLESERGVCVVRPASTIESLDWELVDSSADAILAHLGTLPQPHRLLFDLTDVGYFGSIFLSLLLRCWKHLEHDHGSFAVCCIGAPVHELFAVTHLDRVWKMYPDRASALDALTGKV